VSSEPIYAVPRKPPSPPGVDSAIAVQATAFERANPAAHIVRIPNASHWVIGSNEADVLREMNAFLATLPPQ
jgi:pimeloyl-ACP methyl ester carboxylesterase